MKIFKRHIKKAGYMTVNVSADTSEVDAAIEKAKQLKSLVEEVKALTASIVITIGTNKAN